MEWHNFSHVGSGKAVFNYATVCQKAKHYGRQKFNVNTLRTGDADLRFYITTVQDG